MILRYPFSRGVKAQLGNLLAPLVPIVENRVALVTKPTVPFSGNLRCVADELLRRGKHDVVVYKDGPIDPATVEALSKLGAKVLSGFSISNLRTLLSCEKIMLSHSIRDAHIGPGPKKRTIVNLWHGVPLKRIELLMPDRQQNLDLNRQTLMKQNADLYDYVLASNEADGVSMARAFGVSESQIIKTGLPRFDYFDHGYQLPPDLQKKQEEFKALAAGRAVILYAPTFRENTQSPFARISEEKITQLSRYAAQNNCVFAIRPHPYDLKSARNLLKAAPDTYINASNEKFPEIAIVLRNCDCLVTDYSSVWVDYLYLDKPIIGLIPDIQSYMQEERGFIYDFEGLFPGPLLDSWDAVLSHLNSCKAIAQTKEPQKPFSDGLEGKRKFASELLLPDVRKFKYTEELLKNLELTS